MGKVFQFRNLISDLSEGDEGRVTGSGLASGTGGRFLREIGVVAGLERPNIASLRTALRVDNQLQMIMEYVEGSSLDDRLRQGRINIGRAIHLTYQVLNALSYANRQVVVHRDVKPSNILIGPGDNVKLTDFGIASRRGETSNRTGTMYISINEY